MHKKIFNALTMLNLVGQALYSLVLPMGLGALISFLLTKYASAPSWLWAVLLTLGALTGLYSMIKYVLSATAAMERQRRQSEADLAARIEKEERQAALREAGKSTEEQND